MRAGARGISIFVVFVSGRRVTTSEMSKIDRRDRPGKTSQTGVFFRKPWVRGVKGHVWGGFDKSNAPVTLYAIAYVFFVLFLTDSRWFLSLVVRTRECGISRVVFRKEVITSSSYLYVYIYVPDAITRVSPVGNTFGIVYGFNDELIPGRMCTGNIRTSIETYVAFVRKLKKRFSIAKSR